MEYHYEYRPSIVNRHHEVSVNL